MKTRAQLFRDAKSGKLKLELVERFGKTPYESMKGIRPVVDCNTVNLMLENPDGKISYLEVPKASLMDYSDTELVIYTHGFREPNEKEQKILDEWHDIQDSDDYKKKLQNDLLSDGSSTYWQKKKFFNQYNAGYLAGFEYQNGCSFDFNRYNEGRPDFINDTSVKGDAILKYKVYLD